MQQKEDKKESVFRDCSVFEGLCDCEENGVCRKLEEARKIVYCRDYKCIWNSPLREAVDIKYSRNRVSLGKDDLYRGICIRKEIAISPKHYITGPLTTSISHEVATCELRSPFAIKGHIDITRISGGTITENLTDV